MTALLTLGIPTLFGVSAFLFALSLLPTQSVLAQQLEELRAREPSQRAQTQFAFLNRFLSGERRALLSGKFAEAGWYTMTPPKFLLRVIAGGCFGAVIALLLVKVLPFDTRWVIPVFVLITACGAYAPFFILNQAIDKRKGAIQKALPEFLDMVASTVQAGLALNASLAYAVEAAPGPLGEEIKEALSEIRLGRSRADALKAVGDRTNQPELRNALRIMTQAERLGANIASLLTDLAEDARHRRLMLVEEIAAKLPVKMVFPMVFFMIPAIFTVIFGTLVANYFAPKP